MVVEAGIKQFVLNGLWMIFEECRLAGERPVPDPGYLQTVLWNV